MAITQPVSSTHAASPKKSLLSAGLALAVALLENETTLSAPILAALESYLAAVGMSSTPGSSGSSNPSAPAPTP